MLSALINWGLSIIDGSRQVGGLVNLYAVLLVILSGTHAVCHSMTPEVQHVDTQEEAIRAFARQLYAMTSDIVACQPEKSIPELVRAFNNNCQVRDIIAQAQMIKITSYRLFTRTHLMAQEAEGDDAVFTKVLCSVCKQDWRYWVDAMRPYAVLIAGCACTVAILGLSARSYLIQQEQSMPISIPAHGVNHNLQPITVVTPENTVTFQPILPVQGAPSVVLGEPIIHVQPAHIIPTAQPLVNTVPADTQVDVVVVDVAPVEDVLPSNHHGASQTDMSPLAVVEPPLSLVGEPKVQPQNVMPTVSTTQILLQPQSIAFGTPVDDDDDENLPMDEWMQKEMARSRARMLARAKAEEKAYQEEQKRGREVFKAYLAEQAMKERVVQKQVDNTSLAGVHHYEECCSVCQYTTLKECLDAHVPAYNLDCCSKPKIVARFICQTCYQNWEETFRKEVVSNPYCQLTMDNFRCPCCYKTPFDKNISPIKPETVYKKSSD